MWACLLVNQWCYEIIMENTFIDIKNLLSLIRKLSTFFKFFPQCFLVSLLLIFPSFWYNSVVVPSSLDFLCIPKILLIFSFQHIDFNGVSRGFINSREIFFVIPFLSSSWSFYMISEWHPLTFNGVCHEKNLMALRAL